MNTKKKASNKVNQEESIIAQILKSIPDSIRDVLEDIRIRHDDLRWKLADLTIELFHYSRKVLGSSVKIEHVCAAVAYQLNTDISPASIYNYYLVALKLPTPKLRDKYYPLLPFQHLLEARRLSMKPGAKITFLEILNHDLELLDGNFGRPVSVKKLKAELTGIKQNHNYSFETNLVQIELPDEDKLSGMDNQRLLNEIQKAVHFIEINAMRIQPADALEMTLLSSLTATCRRWMENVRKRIDELIIAS